MPPSGPILIVEDDADIRESLQGFLELQGYEVIAAHNGKEALKHLQAVPRPALILLDMAMPVMDGHRVLTARKENEALAEVPVLILSAGMAAMNPRDRAVYASNYDVAAFLKKPVDPKQLLEILSRYVERPSGAQAGSPA